MTNTNRPTKGRNDHLGGRCALCRADVPLGEDGSPAPFCGRDCRNRMGRWRNRLKVRAKAREAEAQRLRRRADELHDRADGLERSAREARSDAMLPMLPLWAMKGQGAALPITKTEA